MRSFLVDEPRSRALRALNYAPAVERIRRAGSNSARPLREIVKAFGPAYGTVFTRHDCHPDHGIELLSQGDMFAAEPRGRVIRRDSMREPDKHLVEPGQVLIAGAGTLGENELYGRALLADDRLAGKYVGPDSMTLVFEDPGDDFSLFAYAWLASPTGVQAVRSTCYGTKILRFRPDLLTSLPIPMAPAGVIGRVAALVRSCSRAREEYTAALGRARLIVCGLPVMEEALAACATRSRRTVIWDGALPTLSPRNFAWAGTAGTLLRKSWPGRIGDVLTGRGIYTGPRFARIPCEPPHGIELMSQRDMFLVRPLPRRVVRPTGDARRLEVEPGCILFGAVGQISEGSLFGRSYIAAEDTDGVGFSQNIMRADLLPKHRSTSFAFLSTTVGYRLLQSTGVGSGYLAANPNLIATLPIPDFGESDRMLIEDEVSRGVRARSAASTAESEAFRIIEQEVLPQWLA